MDTTLTQNAQFFQTEITLTFKFNYLLYLPPGYQDDPDKQWPLILFLHGMGERGDDLELVKVHGLPKRIEHGDDFPFIIVSPQCPDGSNWQLQAAGLVKFLDDIAANYRVDENRVYLTGLSMGGYGTWHLAMQNPQRFAAIAPICGGGDAANVCRIKDVPVWNFHGEKDSTVTIERSHLMVDALKDCSGNVRFTIYPDAEHDSWTETYKNPELYDWFLEHIRQD